MLVETTIRLGTISDVGFISDSWMKSTRAIYPNMYDTTFAEAELCRIKAKLSTSLTVVSHEVSDPNEIISYIVYTGLLQRPVIYFAYTKADARRQGKISELLSFINPNNSAVIFTQATKNINVMSHFLSKHIYEPRLK